MSGKLLLTCALHVMNTLYYLLHSVLLRLYNSYIFVFAGMQSFSRLSVKFNTWLRNIVECLVTNTGFKVYVLKFSSKSTLRW